MDTALIIILLLILFVYFAKNSIEDEKARQERMQGHWAKIRYIQRLTDSERESIYRRNKGMCQICHSRQKLCFHIPSNNENDWEVGIVQLKCSECSGFSIGYPFSRIIPEGTKNVVWQRDRGQCVSCGSTYNLGFDHIIPFSYGGASADANNIQLLCSSCNSSKHASFKY